MEFIIDGSFEGLLTAIFSYFELKPKTCKLQVKGYAPADVFMPCIVVVTDPHKAKRVWTGLENKLPKPWLRHIWCCYLCEQMPALQILFEFIVYVFKNKEDVYNNYGHPAVLAVADYSKKANREKHRMEAFIRFQLTADHMYYAAIEPDFNVLPLISNHFKDRYSSQQWIIYDIRRKYGIYYNLEVVEEINFDIAPSANLAKPSNDVLAEDENLYAILWKDYFKSVNIEARKNTALHVRHVPKRYWRYLTEKFD